jgi:predicted ATPase
MGPMSPAGRIKLLSIKNFRSIVKARIQFRDLTIFVGPNGAGKSNVLDALRFVSDALTVTPMHALAMRGGVDTVRRKGLRGHPTHFTIRLEIELPAPHQYAVYAFTVGSREKGKGEFAISREKCTIYGQDALDLHTYEIENGVFKSPPAGVEPQISRDRLALSVVSAKSQFRALYDFLVGMRFYNLVPELMRKPQDPDPGVSLQRDGANAAAVVRELRSDTRRFTDICEFLQSVVPGMLEVERVQTGSQETLRFKQDVNDPKGQSLTFLPASVSDGTLRVLGVLLAIYQGSRPSVLGIEEPESTVHPAAAQVLFDAIKHGTQWSQVMITTHSPELIEHEDVPIESLRAVEMDRGATMITELDDVSKKSVVDRLCTPGDLLRNGGTQASKREYASLPNEPNLFSDARADA